MQRIKSIFSNKVILAVVFILLIITVAVTFAYKKTRGDSGTLPIREITSEVSGAAYKDNIADNRPVPLSAPKSVGSLAIDESTSKAILTVSNMSCSGCISTIKGSLVGIEGIKETIVDIANGKTVVYFDNKKLTDVSRIEQAISASGYPAKVQRTLAAEAIKKEKEIAAAKSKYYIASVGGYDIARVDFKTELEIAKKRYKKTYGDAVFSDPRGESLVNNLKTQIAARLVDEGIFMQEIQKAGFKVDDQTIENEFNASLQASNQKLEELERMVTETGYNFDYFKKKFQTQVLINKYLNNKVLADASNDFEKQNAFNAWYQNAKVLAEVVYYDNDLKQLLQTQTSSGGGCCPVK